MRAFVSNVYSNERVRLIAFEQLQEHALLEEESPDTNFGDTHGVPLGRFLDSSSLRQHKRNLEDRVNTR